MLHLRPAISWIRLPIRSSSRLINYYNRQGWRPDRVLNDISSGAIGKMKKILFSLRFAAVVATIFLASTPGISAETAAPSSAASPASAQAAPARASAQA